MCDDTTVHNVGKNGQLLVGAAIGTGEKALERSELLVNKGVDVLVIDTAHGDSKNVYETLKNLKNQYGDKVDIVVGNISIGESAKRLAKAMIKKATKTGLKYDKTTKIIIVSQDSNPGMISKTR